MYWEAKDEGRKGMLAVGAVVLDRVAHEAFPDAPCEVVRQGGETPMPAELARTAGQHRL